MPHGIILPMSLATRCPACGTVFRVVQDQLKVSGGWVRCGQCHQVFNGLQTLFELPPEPPAAAPEPDPPEPMAPAAGLFMTRTVSRPPPAAAETRELAEPDGSGETEAAPLATVDLADDVPEEVPLIDPDAGEPAAPPRPWAYRPQLADDDASEAQTEMPPEGDDALEALEAGAWVEPEVAPEVAAEVEIEAEAEAEAEEVDPVSVEALLAKMDSMARRHTGNFVISQPPPLPLSWPTEVEPAMVMPSVADAMPEDAPPDPAGTAPPPEASPVVEAPDPVSRHSGRKRQRKPTFMRQAERAARWRSPAVRALLGSTCAVLGLMLALQVAHHQRDDLAASWPALREPLVAWCRVAACQLQPPRALASLTLDSSALSRTGRPQVLRFEAELRNSAGHAVRAPALEVSFTDNLGHQLARKVLLPEQMAAPAQGLPPDRPWHIEVPLQVGDLQIAGFTAEVFYP